MAIIDFEMAAKLKIDYHKAYYQIGLCKEEQKKYNEYLRIIPLLF